MSQIQSTSRQNCAFLAVLCGKCDEKLRTPARLVPKAKRVRLSYPFPKFNLLPTRFGSANYPWSSYCPPCFLWVSILNSLLLSALLYAISKDVFSLLGIDYIIAPLKILQFLEESVTVTDPDVKYCYVQRLIPALGKMYNFTEKEHKRRTIRRYPYF